MIKNLQSLRGIAAILIYFHHYGFQSDVCMSFGDFGVIFFMVLSGFVIYLSEEKKWLLNKSVINIKEFMTSRLLKIYPLYLICWILAIAILPYSGSRTGKILGVFALQSWVPDNSIYFAGNSPSWFICDLFFCYLAGVILFNLFNKNSKYCRFLIITYFILYAVTVIVLPDSLVHAIIYINPSMQLCNFLIGFLLCRLFLSEKRMINASYAGFSQILSIATIVLCVALYRYIPERLSLGCYWWIAVIPCIYIFSIFDSKNTWINKLFHCRIVLLTGKLSFSFYIIHIIGICVWHKFLYYAQIANDDIVAKFGQSVILLILLFILSFGVNRYIERPLAEKLKQWAKNRGTYKSLR